MVTEQEMMVMNKSAELWNEFLKLEKIHPHDIPDFQFHLHALQNIILSRSGYRELNIEFKYKVTNRGRDGN